MRLKVRHTRTGAITEVMPVAEHEELKKALKIKDDLLTKIRSEFAEYKANKNKEKAEIVAAKQKAEERLGYSRRDVKSLSDELKQMKDDDARAPWYAELKKERDGLREQVYNLDADNRRIRTFAANRAAIADQQYATVVGERDALLTKLSEKIHLYVHAKKVIAAFERETTKADKNLWQIIIANPELPELKEYIEVKEHYDAERQRKQQESNLSQHQDRASSGPTAAAGNRDSVFTGGQVQTGQAQAVSLQDRIDNHNRAADVIFRRPERVGSLGETPGVEPIYSQSYGRGNRTVTGAQAIIENSKKSFSGILSPAAKEVFERKYARNYQVQGDNADYLRQADLLIAVKNGKGASQLPAS